RPDPLGVVVASAGAQRHRQALSEARGRAVLAALWRPDPGLDAAALLPLVGGDEAARARLAVLCRLGRYQEALDGAGPEAGSAELLFRAWALHGLGRKDEAHKALDNALALLRADNPGAEVPPGWPWDERLEMAELLRQVRGVLGEGGRD